VTRGDKMGLVRILMFVMNFVLWGVGGVLLGIGIWLKVDPTALDAVNFVNSYGMDESVWNASVIILIVVGALVFVVGFLGCLGAMQAKDKPKNFFLKLYFVSVKIIIILEIVAIILAAVYWNSLTDSVRTSMADGARNDYVNETTTGVSQSWNTIQVKWTCCGGNDFTDYKNSLYFHSTNNSVPWTCCVMTPGTAGDKIGDTVNSTLCRVEGLGNYNPTLTYRYLNARGCYDGLKSEIDSNSGLIIGLCSGFIGLEIIGYIFACLIMRGGD
jgi:hypothetical protein